MIELNSGKVLIQQKTKGKKANYAMRWKVSNKQIFRSLGGSSCLSTTTPTYALSEKSIKSKDGITSTNFEQINYNYKE